MDLVAACRVFVSVGERGSFTLGAAAARVPQPVASRRIAALERHLGQRLFDRTARRAVLTTAGRELLTPAKRLVELADGLLDAAEQARSRPLTVAVPESCEVRQLARWAAAARGDGVVLEFRAAHPAARAELLRTWQVRAALIAVAPDAADWVVGLGVASATPEALAEVVPPGRESGQPAPLRLEALRPGRGGGAVRRVWIQPEDDTVPVRDELGRLGARAALLPSQIVVASSLTAAVADVLLGPGLLLCPAAQAGELGLAWRPLHGDPVARGYRVEAVDTDDARPFRTAWHEQVARCLCLR